MYVLRMGGLPEVALLRASMEVAMSSAVVTGLPRSPLRLGSR